VGLGGSYTDPHRRQLASNHDVPTNVCAAPISTRPAAAPQKTLYLFAKDAKGAAGADAAALQARQEYEP
jgi:hypothetical protein